MSIYSTQLIFSRLCDKNKRIWGALRWRTLILSSHCTVKEIEQPAHKAQQGFEKFSRCNVLKQIINSGMCDVIWHCIGCFFNSDEKSEVPCFCIVCLCNEPMSFSFHNIILSYNCNAVHFRSFNHKPKMPDW